MECENHNHFEPKKKNTCSSHSSFISDSGTSDLNEKLDTNKLFHPEVHRIYKSDENEDSNDEEFCSYKKKSLLRKIDVFDQLDDDKKLIVKTRVGDRVNTTRMAEIIMKPSSQKTHKDIEELVSIIKQIKFFQETEGLSRIHLEEIVRSFNIKVM